MRLLLTELNRLRQRRLTWMVFGATTLLTILIAVGVFTQSSSDPVIQQEAIDQAAEDTADCAEIVNDDEAAEGEPFLEEQRRVLSEEEFDDYVTNEYCYQDPDWYGKTPFRASSILSDTQGDWSENRPALEEQIVQEGPTQYRSARSGLGGIIPSTASFFLLIAVVVGASFMGAEYKFGTLENLLLWEPRRLRVLLAKFLAGFLSSAVLTAVVLTFAAAALLLVANLRGTTEGLDGRFWQDLASTIGRASFVGGLFFIISMSVAVIAKNTSAALGVILGWFVVSGIVVELLIRQFRQWELFTNATSFISEADAGKYQRFSGEWTVVYGHNYLAAGLVVAVWSLVFGAIATAVFVRRDVD